MTLSKPLVPHVKDLTEPPVVGQVYRVDCVRLRRTYAVSTNLLIPVLGIPHKDPEVSFPTLHYHHDMRFLPHARLRELFIYRLTGDVRQAMSHVIRVSASAQLETRPMKCLRLLPEFPMVDAHGNCANFTSRLQPLYAHRRLDLSQPICPHKGLSLTGLPVDAEGCVVCPLHGLKWSLRTGEMVVRDCPAEESPAEGRAL